ncbi:hypothetical protein AMTR_s00074p00043010 [Amborella trichopoda]|uniref:Uncharacterized protein n=1 Tax=Amborella trichopoda TaxID=13333 RepID=W1NMU9_AMBTC|nr:hypothetical protein AMTR_s00074p00043010 [Amborella trichopoda]
MGKDTSLGMTTKGDIKDKVCDKISKESLVSTCSLEAKKERTKWSAMEKVGESFGTDIFLLAKLLQRGIERTCGVFVYEGEDGPREIVAAVNPVRA